MHTIKRYLSLVKFSHTILAMPFALIGLFLGLYHVRSGKNQIIWNDFDARGVFPAAQSLYTIFEGYEPILISVLVLLCMVFARSAAMAFNRYLDRHYDKLNPRTAVREIPSGTISASSALLFTIGSSGLFVACCFFINSLCFYLAPVALLVILGYSFTKRFTALCHLILGLGLSLAPLGAYLAVTGTFAILPVLFSIAVICWVSGFDIIYSLQDEEFDISQQLNSIPAWIGKSRALHVSELLHILSAIAVIIAGWYGDFGIFYWIGVVVFVGMLIYQHSIVQPQDLTKVNVAFMTSNGIASLFFAIFVIIDITIH